MPDLISDELKHLKKLEQILIFKRILLKIIANVNFLKVREPLGTFP